MKYSIVSGLGLAAVAHSHAIFQVISVNGEENDSLYGLRTPAVNDPVQDIYSDDLICGAVENVDTNVVEVNAGDDIGAWYQHMLPGQTYEGGTEDNPIAASHKGPVTAWLAKVDDASSAEVTGQQWFKIFEDNLDTSTGKWGVDHLIENDGWVHFQIPQCVQDGEYLLRVEVLALHSAYDAGEAQFFTSCANLRVSGGSGSLSPETSSIPGVYDMEDESILISIYGNSGEADNNGEAYEAPGPRPVTC